MVQYEINRIEDLKHSEDKDKALEEILSFIKNEDLAIQLTAVEALSSFAGYLDAKNALIQLLNHENSEIRMYAIESLSSFSGEDIGTVILPRLDDEDSLVRISAVELLGDIGYKLAVPRLCETLTDKEELVRAYAAEALGKIGDQSIIPILEQRLETEKRNIAKLGFYIGLYLLGLGFHFKNVINMLKCKSYRVCCAAANSLVNLADKQNYSLIIESLKKALSKENSVAVTSTIKAALSDIEEIFS